jgi:hypothetical protein
MTTNPFARKDPELKAAVEMLATGQVSAALKALQKQDRIREIPDTEERIRAIARSYIESPERTLIVSPDNASRRELNDAFRPCQIPERLRLARFVFLGPYRYSFNKSRGS